MVYSLYALALAIGTAFCVRFHRLAIFYSRSFLLGTLYDFLIVLVSKENTSKSLASACSATRAYLARPIVSRKLPLVVGFEPTKKFIKAIFIILLSRLLYRSNYIYFI